MSRSLLDGRLLQEIRNSFKYEARICWSLSEQAPSNFPPVYTWPVAVEPSIVTDDDVGGVLNVYGAVTKAGGDVGYGGDPFSASHAIVSRGVNGAPITEKVVSISLRDLGYYR